MNVGAVNDAPVLASAIAGQASAEDGLWTFQVPAGTFADVDSALSYTAALGNGDPLPAWLNFDPDTQTFTGTPPQDFDGQIDLKVTASDGQYTASDTFTLDVTPVNDAPVLAHTIPDQLSPEDAPWTFEVPANTFTDVDNATLAYEATLENGDPLPLWLSFDAQTQTFSGTPPQGFSGQFDLKVTASDGQYSASDIFTLNISSSNQAPNVASDPNPPNHPLLEDNVRTCSVVVSVTDSPGDMVHYDMTDWTPVIPTALGATEFGGHYYLMVDVSWNWTDAQAYAQSLGGYLANITSQAENDFVLNTITGTRGVDWRDGFRSGRQMDLDRRS